MCQTQPSQHEVKWRRAELCHGQRDDLGREMSIEINRGCRLQKDAIKYCARTGEVYIYRRGESFVMFNTPGHARNTSNTMSSLHVPETREIFIPRGPKTSNHMLHMHSLIIDQVSGAPKHPPLLLFS